MLLIGVYPSTHLVHSPISFLIEHPEGWFLGPQFSINTSSEDFVISKGDRIAQLLFQKIEIARFIPVEILPESSRGETGFGSSGKN